MNWKSFRVILLFCVLAGLSNTQIAESQDRTQCQAKKEDKKDDKKKDDKKTDDSRSRVRRSEVSGIRGYNPGSLLSDDELPRGLSQSKALPSDSSFARFVDEQAVAEAILKHDADTIADMGLLLLEGERVLQRPHKDYSADGILAVAAGLAISQNESATIARLKKVAQEKTLPQLSLALDAEGDKTRGESALLSMVAKHKDDELGEPLRYCVDRITIAKLLRDAALLETAKQWPANMAEPPKEVQDTIAKDIEQANQQISDELEDKTRGFGLPSIPFCPPAVPGNPSRSKNPFPQRYMVTIHNPTRSIILYRFGNHWTSIGPQSSRDHSAFGERPPSITFNNIIGESRENTLREYVVSGGHWEFLWDSDALYLHKR